MQEHAKSLNSSAEGSLQFSGPVPAL